MLSGTAKALSDGAYLRGWFNNSSPSVTGFMKAGHLLRPDITVLPYITEYWDDFKPFILKLITACFHGDPGQPNHLTHDEMINILTEAFNTIEEPLETGSKRSNHGVDDRQNKKGKLVHETLKMRGRLH